MTVFSLIRLALWVSGSTHGVHEMSPTPSLASSWKMTLTYRHMPTAGCTQSTVPTVTVATLSGLHYKAITYHQDDWRLRKVTQYSCTRLWEHGAPRPDHFTGGDFRSFTYV